jgi:ATP-dependent DNA ligase
MSILQMLPWFPPAPAPGPASLLELPPDDWALEPKLDGIRVILFEGVPYARHGKLLTAGKGGIALAKLGQALRDKGLRATIDGEWLPKLETFHAFDLPDDLSPYDERRAHLLELIEHVGFGHCGEATPALWPINAFHANFPQTYAKLKESGAEGVVFKRRGSVYARQTRPGVEVRDWLKRRFRWDTTAPEGGAA